LAQPVQKNVPSDAIRGAALTAATLSLLASKSLVFSGVAGLGAAYVAISPGTVGDSLRVVGSGAWGTAEYVSQFLVSSNVLGSVAKVLLTTAMEAIRQVVVSIEQASSSYSNMTSQLAELDKLHSDVEQVLIQAEEAMRTAEAAMEEATVIQDEATMSENEFEDIKKSVDDELKVLEQNIEVVQDKIVENTSVADELEDADDMQDSLGVITAADLKGVGDIISEDDLQQRTDLFLDEMPVGMEGDDEIGTDVTQSESEPEKTGDDVQGVVTQVEAADVEIEEVASSVEELEDVEYMQESLGVTSVEDVKEFGDFTSEEDLQQSASLFLEGVPVGMEGDDIEEAPQLVDTVEETKESLKGIALEDTQAIEEVISYDDVQRRADPFLEEAMVGRGIDDEVEDRFEEKEELQEERIMLSEEDLQDVEDNLSDEDLLQEFGMEPDLDFEIGEDLSDVFDEFSEDDLEELFLEDDPQATFSDEVPEGIEADEKDDVFVLDEEPEFAVGDPEDSGLDVQESTTEFGDLAPEGLWQEDADFDVLDEDPDLGLMAADDQSSNQEESELRADFARSDANEEADSKFTSISKNDWDASIRLAKKGLEGTIVGIDEAVADMSEKADWDAAKRLAQALNQQEIVPDEVGVDEDEADMEALGRAAREAVQRFDEQRRIEQDEIRQERKKWEDEMVARLSESPETDDSIAFETDEEDLEEDLEEIAKAARAAVEVFEAQRAGNDKKPDIDADEDDFALEPVMDEESELATFYEEDLEEIARAARAAVEVFEREVSLEASDESSASRSAEAIRDWSQLSFVQLKDELKARGLSTKGKKADLISTLSKYEESLSAVDIQNEEMTNKQQNDGNEETDASFFAPSQEEDIVLEDISDQKVARDWSTMSVAQLKDELKVRGLGTKGKKGDLVSALLEYEANLYDEDEVPSFKSTDDASPATISQGISLIDGDTRGEWEPEITGRDWATLTTAELKKELKALGLSVQGKKSELVDRLIEFEERSVQDISASLIEPDVIGSLIGSDLPEEPSDEALMQIEMEESSLLSDALSDNYDNMSVAQLKEELRKRGLQVGGKKDELIERLRSSESN
jgi:hypothetical protein